MPNKKKKQAKKVSKKVNYPVEILKRLDIIVKLLSPEIAGVGEKSDERFIDNGDGTISDTRVLPNGKRLMWQKEGSSETMVHSSAEKYCKDSNVGGYKDWRLPTVEELFSLVDYTKKDPAINELFKCNSNWYWTSTIYAGGSGSAWVVGFNGGYVYWSSRDDGLYVRAVRQY